MIVPALVLSTALLATQPAELPYTGGPIPDGYELVTEYNTRLLFVGWAISSLGYMVGGVYGTAAGIHSLAAFQRADPFFALLPLAGPFLALGSSGYRSQLDPGALAVHDAVLIGSGVLQILGAAMAGVAYFFPTRVVRLKPQRPAGGPPPEASLVPLGPGGGVGLTLSLAF
jgi:hypothetical protein